jgi:hypothetical protein
LAAILLSLSPGEAAAAAPASKTPAQPPAKTPAQPPAKTPAQPPAKTPAPADPPLTLAQKTEAWLVGRDLLVQFDAGATLLVEKEGAPLHVDEVAPQLFISAGPYIPSYGRLFLNAQLGWSRIGTSRDGINQFSAAVAGRWALFQAPLVWFGPSVGFAAPSSWIDHEDRYHAAEILFQVDVMASVALTLIEDPDPKPNDLARARELEVLALRYEDQCLEDSSSVRCQALGRSVIQRIDARPPACHVPVVAPRTTLTKDDLVNVLDYASCLRRQRPESPAGLALSLSGRIVLTPESELHTWAFPISAGIMF